ncbi:MAG: cellulose biosynthesis protein BcsS [Hyphomicrobium sp.]|nr:cellulose biosynthesis protein BcsS [Hyphomicrobium sp.]
MPERSPVPRCARPRLVLWTALAAALLSLTPLSVAAQETRPSWRDVWKWRETWSGVDVARDNWLVYSGITVAPFGHIHDPGWRVRLAGGYGNYEYSGNRSTTPTPDIQSFSAATYYGDALVGYLERFGPLTAKAFGGLSYIAHDITPFDPENLVVGDDIGVKGVLELWLDIGEIGFASLDASWSSAHDTRNARARLGAYITPSISTGLEGWLNLDNQSDCDLGWDNSVDCYVDEKTHLFDYTRAGLFLRYTWDGGELSLSGGISGGSFQTAGDAEPEPYATLNWLTQF